MPCWTAWPCSPTCGRERIQADTDRSGTAGKHQARGPWAPVQARAERQPRRQTQRTVSLKAALARALMKQDAIAIARRLIARAKSGNVGAVKLLLNHLPECENNDPLGDILSGLSPANCVGRA